MLSGKIVFIIRAISPKRLGGSVNVLPSPKGDTKGIHNLNHSPPNSVQHIFFRPPDKMLFNEIVFNIRAISPKRLGGSVNLSPSTKGDTKGIHKLTYSPPNSVQHIFFQPPDKNAFRQDSFYHPCYLTEKTRRIV